MSEISKTELQTLIEAHFHNVLNQEQYEVKKIQARQLLSYDRFDVAFKLHYLNLKSDTNTFARDIYEDHIRAFSLGEFLEPGDSNKSGIDSFIEEFDKTYEDLAEHGFNPEKSIIPLSQNGSIANGAHRLASAIHLNKEVNCVEIGSQPYRFDYQYFYQRNVPQKTLDAVATTFIEQTAPNVYVAIIWPVAEGKDDEITNIIPNIIYRKEISLNANGARNLIPLIYAGEPWLGHVGNNFKGSEGKTVECFKSSKPMRVIAFQAENLEAVLKIKDQVRDVFNIGKHAIHISDDQAESIKMSHVLFNDNTIHFLNYAKPNRFLSAHNAIKEFKEFLSKNDIETVKTALDGGMVLSIYGLREGNDIDYFSIDEKPIQYIDSNIEINDDELVNHALTKHEIVMNPKYYFYFYGIKVVSFAQLHQMKKRRHKERDINDCKMMDALLENNKLKEMSAALQQKILYSKIKLKERIIQILKKLHLLNFVEKILGR